MGGIEPFEIKVGEGQLIYVESERGGRIGLGGGVGELIRLGMADFALGSVVRDGPDLESSRRE